MGFDVTAAVVESRPPVLLGHALEQQHDQVLVELRSIHFHLSDEDANERLQVRGIEVLVAVLVQHDHELQVRVYHPLVGLCVTASVHSFSISRNTSAKKRRAPGSKQNYST